MTAERLREAARLMRERADVATPGPWVETVLGSEGYDVRGGSMKVATGSRLSRRLRVARCGHEAWETDKANAEHIASWHPIVALAVADWLDFEAEHPATAEGMLSPEAGKVADAYLGGAS